MKKTVKIKKAHKPHKAKGLVGWSFSRISLLIFGVVFAVIGGYFLLRSFAETTPPQYACAGAPADSPRTLYPEKRIFLETQAWWTPVAGTGKTGHIHVATCAPLYQTVVAKTIHLDLKWQLHDMDGPNALVPQNFFVNQEGVYTIANLADFPTRATSVFPRPQCSTIQCQGWISVDLDLSSAPTGWFDFNTFIQGFFPNDPAGCQFFSDPQCRQLRTLNHWPVRFETGNPEVFFKDNGNALNPADPGSMYTGGESWFTRGTASCCGSAYARTFVIRPEVEKLWNTQTGQLVPKSGTFTMNLGFEKEGARVMVDPAFHAVPPSAGTVLLDAPSKLSGKSYQYYDVAIDTTRFTNGLHRLVIQDKYLRDNGEQSGLLAIPFLVNNPTTPPPPPPTTATVSLSANPQNINSGSSTMLTWTSTNTTSCMASGGWNGVKSVSGSEATDTLSKTTTYTITCAGTSGDSATASTTVTVNTSTAKKCDFNNDLQVNIQDLSILLSNFGKMTTAGDCNADGKVDIVDLSILLGNYGS